MIIKPARTIPDVLKRAFDAFRANDPIGMAEAYALDATLTTQYDVPLAQAVGLDHHAGPVVASSAVGILRFYAYELSMFDVQDVEIVSFDERAKHTDAVCRWSLRLVSDGREIEGFCRNRWVLDQTGRQIKQGESYCGLLPARQSLTAN